MKAIDLFSGCGGLSLGLEQEGVQILCAYENWSAAIECYQANFTHPVRDIDLTEHEQVVADVISSFGDGQVDMVVGGPPCQDFSHAGLRNEGERANLTLAFAKVVAALNSDWFIMENVDRAQKSIAYQQAREEMIASGYGLTEIVLDASLCGVPQKRKRFFVIGKRGEANGFLLNQLIEGLADKPMTVRDYLGDSLGVDHYYRHPRNYNRRGIFSIDEPAPTIRGVNRPVPSGYKGHGGDTAPINGELRPLTTKERSRIQTFPEQFRLTGSKTAQEQMIGNAVPVNLAAYVARAVLDYRRSDVPPEFELVSESCYA